MNLKQRIITTIILLAMLATTIISAVNAVDNNSQIDFIVSTSPTIEPTKEIFIKPNLKNADSSKVFKNFHDFLSYTSAHGYVAGIEFIKSIFHISVNNKLTDGFVFKETKDSNGKLIFTLTQNIMTSKNNLLPLQSYDTDNAYKHILINKNNYEALKKTDNVLAHLTDENGMSIVLRSKSLNYLIIPKGQYTSILDFSRDAKDAEIIDILKHVKKTADHLKSIGKNYIFCIHVGSIGYQVVPHLHLRIEPI